MTDDDIDEINEAASTDAEGQLLIDTLGRVHHALLQLRGVNYFPASEFDIRKETLFSFPGKHPLAKDRRLLVLPWRKSTMPALFNHIAKSVEKLKRFMPFTILVVSADQPTNEDTQNVLKHHKARVCSVVCGDSLHVHGEQRYLPRRFADSLAHAPDEIDIDDAQAQGKKASAEIMSFFDQMEKTISSPKVTRGLLAITLAWFFYGSLKGISLLAPGSADLIPLGAMDSRLLAEGEYWRLFSASFVHVGALHLGINMFCLTLMGPTCERLMGHLRFFVLYLLSGVCGFLLSVAINGDVVTAGASASIFGVAGGVLGSMLGRARSVPRQLLIPTLKSVSLFFVLNLAIGMSVTFVNIDNAAHAGGFFGGLALGALLVNKKTTS